MPRRSYQRSQSLAFSPAEMEAERAFRRASRELRDFHRARSLDVILEEDHHSMDGMMNDNQHSGGLLKKKGACLCLADLVAAESEEGRGQDQDADGSENTSERELEEEDSQQHSFAGSGSMDNGHGCWGHFTADSPSSSTSEAELPLHHHRPSNHHHRTRMYPAFTIKGRTIRGMVRS